MSYNNFTIKEVKNFFQLETVEKLGIFSPVEEITISEYLTITLEENIPLAVSINTQKAYSELIIANILVEMRKVFNRQISFFSGISFNVDEENNLFGNCDFVISASPEQLFLNAPVTTIIEAKNENMMSHLGECVAKMVAAKLFNEQEGDNNSKIYGVITSGIAWKFIKLDKNTIYIDLKDYHIDNTSKLVGILAAMIRQEA
jgi:hypothetical protein